MTFLIVIFPLDVARVLLVAERAGGAGGGGPPSFLTSTLTDFFEPEDSECTVCGLRGGAGTVFTFDSLGAVMDTLGGRAVLVRERMDTDGAGGG